MRWSRRPESDGEAAKEWRLEKKEATNSPQKLSEREATFLLLREISYSSNACLELCGAHVNGKSPADCSDNEFGGFGGGYGEK